MIILSLIFLEFYFKFLTTLITGLVTIAMSIASRMEITMEFLDMPTQVVQLTTVAIRVGLWNSGSIELNESTLVFEVRDMNNNTASITEKPVFNLSLGERREVSTSWYASPSPGLYTMYVRAVYDNDTSNVIASNFSILPPPYVPPTERPRPPITRRIANISVSYPPRLNLTQDAEYIVLIKVKNTGNVKIHNITLELESSYIDAEVIYPDILSVLEVGSSVIFTTKLKVSVDLEPGNYTIDWFVFSDDVNRTGEIIGEVRVLDIREKAKELLAYYKVLLERLDDEINEAETEGKNVTLARNLLNDANREFDVTYELFRLGLYAQSIEQLKLVMEIIVEVVRALVLAETIKKPFVLPALPVIPCLIWVIIVIIVNSVVVLSMVKKLHLVKIVIIMIIVSLLIGLISGLECLVWVAVTVLVMVLVFVLIILRERLRKEPTTLARFRRW